MYDAGTVIEADPREITESTEHSEERSWAPTERWFTTRDVKEMVAKHFGIARWALEARQGSKDFSEPIAIALSVAKRVMPRHGIDYICDLFGQSYALAKIPLRRIEQSLADSGPEAAAVEAIISELYSPGYIPAYRR